VAGRLARAFAAARGRTGLIPYLTAGYPSLAATASMMRRLAESGALAIEIGVPFSDPIADGLEIQRSSEWAVRNGVGAADAIELVRGFRADGFETPVVVMTYANPILALGIRKFAMEAAAAGIDGVLVSDLPPDESPDTWQALVDAGLDPVLLVAPTTPSARLPGILERCRGFVYCLSRTGVTGRSAGETGDLAQRLSEVRAGTSLPIAIGFGISTPDHAAALRGKADAVVVGAAFVRAIAENPEQDAETRVVHLARSLEAALRA
jgi:tryptophan synthase alpha chain